MEVVSVFFSKLGFLVKTMCLVLASFQEEVHWMCSTIHFREETSIHHSKEEATRYRSFLKATELRLSTKLTSIFAHIASTDVGCNNHFSQMNLEMTAMLIFHLDRNIDQNIKVAIKVKLLINILSILKQDTYECISRNIKANVFIILLSVL